MSDSQSRKRACVDSDFSPDPTLTKSSRQLDQESVLDKDPIGSFSQASAATQDEFDLPSFNPPLIESQWAPSSNEEYEEDADLTAPFLFDLPQDKPRDRQGSISSVPSIEFPNTQRDTIISDFSSVQEGLPNTLEKKTSDADSIVSDFSTDFMPPPVEEPPALPPQPPPVLRDPVEFDPLAHKIPSPFPDKRNKRKLVDLAKGGLADLALESANRERKAHRQWEASLNQQLTHYGNLVELYCQQDTEIFLFRMLETWSEGGLVFSWCVLLKEEEVELLRSRTTLVDESSQDIITDFTSQPIVRLPDYQQDSQEEKFLFAFSAVYLNIAMDRFIHEEQVVGIWPAWTEIQVDLNDYGPCTVNLATKFRPNSVY